MRWLTIVVAVIVLTGCSDSHDATAPDTSTNETTVAGAPNAYTRLMAQLPPFDEPASPEVTAYRRATIGARAARCAESRGADRAAFVRANAKVLEQAGIVRRARLRSERAVGHRDGNGCPEDSGPRTYFTTNRTYGLPAGTARLPSSRTTRACSTTAGSRRAAPETASGRSRGRRLPLRRRLHRPEAQAHGAGPHADANPRGGAAASSPVRTQVPRRCGQVHVHRVALVRARVGRHMRARPSLDVPSIILPPPPGVRAELRGARIVVEWSFERILGDCPPTQIILSFASASSGKPAYVTRVAVRGHSGIAAISVPDAVRGPRCSARRPSPSTGRSRTVAILIRRRT